MSGWCVDCVQYVVVAVCSVVVAVCGVVVAVYSVVWFVQLRTHLGHVHKHQHQQTAINLNNPDSQAMHLETRLVQLDSAINMELWQVSAACTALLQPAWPQPSLR